MRVLLPRKGVVPVALHIAQIDARILAKSTHPRTLP
jgi:hypothetical protein